MKNKPLFSVVTVCYNASNLIRKTVESVLAQDYSGGFEYIIQDGASSDDTLSIVNEYLPQFEDKGIKITLNSKKDEGLYDAMNKSIVSCEGTYVIFMNADDCFYSEDVLSSVAKSLECYSDNKTVLDFINDDSKSEHKLPDIVYGDCIVKELGMYFKFRKCFDLIKDRMPFSHQSCFAKLELLKEIPLNLEYRITADYCFLLDCFLKGKSFHDSDVMISLVTADGLSSLHMYDTFVEVNKVCNSLGVKRFSDNAYVKKQKEMKLKQFVLSYFPKSIVKAIRKRQIKKRGQDIKINIPPWA